MKKPAKEQTKEAWFQLSGGIKCYLRDPARTITDPSIVIRTFPAAAAKICRFGAQLHTFYSLAQHSYGVAKRVKFLGGTVAQQLQGALHDSAETFLGGDIPTPVRRCISGYDELEESFLDRIFDVYQLPRKIDALVWRADDEMKVLEGESFIEGGPLDNWTHLYLKPKISRIDLRRSCFSRGEFLHPWDFKTAEAKLWKQLFDLTAAHFYS